MVNDRGYIHISGLCSTNRSHRLASCCCRSSRESLRTRACSHRLSTRGWHITTLSASHLVQTLGRIPVTDTPHMPDRPTPDDPAIPVPTPTHIGSCPRGTILHKWSTGELDVVAVFAVREATEDADVAGRVIALVLAFGMVQAVEGVRDNCAGQGGLGCCSHTQSRENQSR